MQKIVTFHRNILRCVCVWVWVGETPTNAGDPV